MKKLALLFILLFSAILHAQIKVENLLTENLVNPIGIDELQPNLSWQLSSEKYNVMQSGYELRVADNEGNLKSQPLWNSGKINSDQSIHVSYKGKALISGKRYFWQVRVWDNKGNVSAWS